MFTCVTCTSMQVMKSLLSWQQHDNHSLNVFVCWFLAIAICSTSHASLSYIIIIDLHSNGTQLFRQVSPSFHIFFNVSPFYFFFAAVFTDIYSLWFSWKIEHNLAIFVVAFCFSSFLFLMKISRNKYYVKCSKFSARLKNYSALLVFGHMCKLDLALVWFWV